MKKLAVNKSVWLPSEVIKAMKNGILIIAYVSTIQFGDALKSARSMPAAAKLHTRTTVPLISWDKTKLSGP